MFTPRKKHIASLLAFGAALALGQSAYAVGVASGTSVQNDVTVDYSVGGVNQTAVTDSVSFVVDNMVDLTVVVAASPVTVSPGSFDRVLQFDITNTGNTTQGYALSATNSAGFAPVAAAVIVIDGGNGTFDSSDGAGGVLVGGDDVIYVGGANVNAGDLDPNGGTDTMRVWVVIDVPNTPTVTDGDTSDYDLRAITLNAGTAVNAAGTATTASAGAWTLDVNGNHTTVQVVFADAGNNGEETDSGTFEVASADLVVTKTQSIISDGIGGVAPNAKAIPGATVRYTITLVNNGSVDAIIPSAAGVGVVDNYDETNLTYTASSVDLAITGGGTDTNIPDNSNGTNTGAFVDTSTAGEITINDFTVPAGQTATITFDATIQ